MNSFRPFTNRRLTAHKSPEGNAARSLSTAVGWTNRRGLRDQLRAFGVPDRTHEDRRDDCSCQIVGDMTVLGPRSCSSLRAHVDNTVRRYSTVVARSGLTVLCP